MTKTSRSNKAAWIAEKTGYSADYVRRVLRGKFPNTFIENASAIYEKKLTEAESGIEKLQEVDQ